MKNNGQMLNCLLKLTSSYLIVGHENLERVVFVHTVCLKPRCG